MPRCEGLPTGPCRNNTIDPIAVKNSQGDLFLCQSCEDFRLLLRLQTNRHLRQTSENKAPTTPTSSASITMSTSVNKVSAASANRVATMKSTSTVDSLHVSNNTNNETSKPLTDIETSSELIQCEVANYSTS